MRLRYRSRSRTELMALDVAERFAMRMCSAISSSLRSLLIATRSWGVCRSSRRLSSLQSNRRLDSTTRAHEFRTLVRCRRWTGSIQGKRPAAASSSDCLPDEAGLGTAAIGELAAVDQTPRDEPPTDCSTLVGGRQGRLASVGPGPPLGDTAIGFRATLGLPSVLHMGARAS